MPIVPSYPGIYVQEVPSGVRTLVGVPTSITAFVGRTFKGPVETPVTIHRWVEFETIFGGLSHDSPLSYAVNQYFLNGGHDAVIVRVGGTRSAKTKLLPRPARAGTESRRGAASDTPPAGGASPPPAPAPEPAPGKASWELEAISPGEWGNNLVAFVDQRVAENHDELFNLGIAEKDANGRPRQTEEYRNLSINPVSPRYVKEVLSTSKLVRLASDAPGVPGLTTPAAGRADSSSTAIVKVATDGQLQKGFEFEGGADGSDQPDLAPGLAALERASLFNLLVIPQPDWDSDVPPAIWAEAAALCEKRRAFLIVDAPRTWTGKAEAVAGATKPIVQSNNAAIFFPRILFPDALAQNRPTDFAPSGVVAGVFARTDAQRGIWKAPAGVDATLNGVRGLTVSLTDDDQGELNPLGVNCLRTMPILGSVLWGARTTRGADELASEWKYVPVRRLALYIEESLYRGLKWVVFEPNDEPLWAQVRLSVGSFMNGLFRQGAFKGPSTKEGYLVKCDAETNPPEDVALGIVNVVVGFAPVYPAEFVILKISQLSAHAQA